MLTTEAFNALLKTLEEPPPHVKFVFATTEPQKIPVTILSRCQRFDFKRVGQAEIVDHLQMICESEGLDAERAALQLIARQASGGMRDALSLLDQVISFAGSDIREEQVAQILGVANRTHLFELSDAILGRDAGRALSVLDEVHRYGYDLNQFAAEMVHHLRDVMVARVVEEPERVTSLTQSELDAVRAQIAQVPPELIHRIFSVMMGGAQEMSRSPYPKLVLEMTLVRVCQLEPMVGIDLLLDQVRALEAELGPESEDEGKKKSERVAQLAAPAPTPAPIADAIASVLSHRAPAPAPAPKAPPEQRHAPSPPVAPVAPAALVALDPPATPTVSAAPKGSSAAPTASVNVAAPSISPFDDVGADRGAPEAPARDAAPAPPTFVTEEIEPPEPSTEPAMGEGEQAPAPRYETFALPDAPRARAPEAHTPDPDLDQEEAASPSRPPAPSLNSNTLGRADTWRQLVTYIRSYNAPLAATLEHAYVESFDAATLSLTFMPRYLNFVHDADRIAPLRDALLACVGGSCQLKTGVRHEERAAPGFETLAQLRDIEATRRRDELAAATESHPLIKHAERLFDPGAMRVLVALKDE